MKKIALYVFSGLLVVCGGFILLTNKTTTEDITTHLSTVKAKADSSQVPYVSDTSYVPNYLSSSSLTEIVVSPEDIISSDSSNLIGSQPAYNKSYVNEEDVKESLNRILESIDMKLDSFDVEYHDYLVNLRHIEMKEGVSETHSNIIKVAEEYTASKGQASQ